MIFLAMKTTLPSQTKRKANVEWVKTPYPNLIRYKPSGTYFGRLRVNGKLIRRSLETHVLTVAKLKLSDFLQDHRRLAINKGESVSGEVIIEMFKKEIEDDHNNKPRTKLYKQEVLTALKKVWPELYLTDIARIGQKDCNEWAARYGKEYSPTRYNGALGVVRRIFEIAVEHGYRVDNPAKFVDRRRVKPKELHLPSQGQFQEMATHIETSGAGQSKDCANLFRFLAFSGLRIDEARHVVWNDVDFEKGLLHARITKNGKDRWIPLNSSLRQLLEKMRMKRAKESADKIVMQVFECQKSIDRAAKLVGVKRITHHDLRHLFATRCIEAGVDIPTVSRWLGHQDGGALCMKTYGHLRDEHSLREALKVTF
ncbi:MAG TPA: integrase [Candidatus Binatia bacterium]|nr:integrase [Candidatus Binatia bacterium]